MILNLYKERGETPLQCIERFRAAHAEYADEPLSYAGRLDPMAEGVLLVLAGAEANTEESRQRYLGLNKEYRFDILCGVETDTGDVLGMVTKTNFTYPHLDMLPAILEKLKGKRTQVYPTYSSRTVQGKALFEWAREGRLDEIEVPSREIEIYALEMVSSDTVPRSALETSVVADIGKVVGDFRQQESIVAWRGALQSAPEHVLVLHMHVSCSSGTYVRTLIQEIAGQLGISALAYSITRAKAGAYRIEDSIRG